MLMRNRLKAGDYVIPVPVGIPMELFYNSCGVLSGVRPWNKFDGELSVINMSTDEYPKYVLEKIKDMKCVPSMIPISANTAGTTVIYGILTADVSDVMGTYPMDIVKAVLEKRHDINGQFKAFGVISNAVQIKGFAAIRKWLNIAKFSVLPGFLFPAADISQFDKLVNNTTSNITMSYVSYNLDSCYIHDAGLRHLEVTTHPSEFYNCNGVLCVKFSLSDNSTRTVPFQTASKHKICVKSKLVVDGYFNILKSTRSRSVLNRIDYSKRSCLLCGRELNLSQSIIQCSDEFCMSRMYSSANHMLATLRLPTFNWEQYFKYVKDTSISNIVDLIDLIYQDSHKIEISLETLFQSAIPENIVGNRKSISQFVSLCRNRWKTLLYYMDAPERIVVDFEIGSCDIRELVECFHNKHYVTLINKLYSHPKINIVETDKLYEADAIFRGTTICITGDFNIGSMDDVKGILGSYGAKVVTELEDNTRYVILGDTNSNFDSKILSRARELHIPIISEYKFLKKFEIDKDIEANLL